MVDKWTKGARRKIILMCPVFTGEGIGVIVIPEGSSLHMEIKRGEHKL